MIEDQTPDAVCVRKFEQKSINLCPEFRHPGPATRAGISLLIYMGSGTHATDAEVMAAKVSARGL